MTKTALTIYRYPFGSKASRHTNTDYHVVAVHALLLIAYEYKVQMNDSPLRLSCFAKCDEKIRNYWYAMDGKGP